MIEATGDLNVSNGTTNLQVTALGSTLISNPRFGGFLATFYRVRIKRITIIPKNLASGQYIEYAVQPTHLPYLASSGDVVPSATSVIATVLTLPGAKRVQQGNGAVQPLTQKFKPCLEFQCNRVAVDTPTLLMFHTYSTANTSWSIFVQCVFMGYSAAY